jgi:hypothetical protein
VEGYLGEKVVKTLKGTPFEYFTPVHWALHFVESYGQIDGDHHKLWVLDQVARILNGTPVIVSRASWKSGHSEYRYSTGKPSKGYLDWVERMRRPGGEDGEEYGYDEGIAP